MDKIIPSMGGYLTGFIVSTLIWGKTEGDSGIITNLRFTLFNKSVALHHWMLFLILTVFLLLFRNRISLSDKSFYFILGLLWGGLNQGLTYKDWFKII